MPTTLVGWLLVLGFTLIFCRGAVSKGRNSIVLDNEVFFQPFNPTYDAISIAAVKYQKRVSIFYFLLDLDSDMFIIESTPEGHCSTDIHEAWR